MQMSVSLAAFFSCSYVTILQFAQIWDINASYEKDSSSEN